MAKETLRKAGYVHYAYLGTGEHVLLNTATGEFEVWVANKSHASYGLIYKNTHLEFVRGLGKTRRILAMTLASAKVKGGVNMNLI